MSDKAPFALEAGQSHKDRGGRIPRYPSLRSGEGGPRAAWWKGPLIGAKAPTTAFQAVPLPRFAALRRGGDENGWL